ncbi:snurportin 1 [Trichuris trichiura]|uniref:Snurportin-1 n=1 Tax=Trichuris trichiura TaxID=36087 RepID=A0A077ZCN3_TRITR|nr:snurportin 1 [Trichuris trichiura]
MANELETAAESLSGLLATSVLDNKSTFSIYRPHPRFAMYKTNITMEACQEKRRKLLLQNQRDKRFELISQLRRLYKQVDCSSSGNDSKMDDSESNLSDVQCDGIEERQFESLEDESKSGSSKGHQKKSYFSDRLMMGEWLVELPTDFNSNWLFMPYPEGRRCLIVANQKWTLSYSRAGRRLAKFKSALPEATMLDCVSCGVGDTLYVLDVLMWKGQTLVDYDCEFRSFWIAARLEDSNLNRNVNNHCNRKRLVALPKYKYSQSMLQNVISSRLWPFPGRLDGLLFYHRSCLYESGETPLVGWLKPFMLNDVLGVMVPPEYTNTDELLIQDFNKAARKKGML